LCCNNCNNFNSSSLRDTFVFKLHAPLRGSNFQVIVTFVANIIQLEEGFAVFLHNILLPAEPLFLIPWKVAYVRVCCVYVCACMHVCMCVRACVRACVRVINDTGPLVRFWCAGVSHDGASPVQQREGLGPHRGVHQAALKAAGPAHVCRSGVRHLLRQGQPPFWSSDWCRDVVSCNYKAPIILTSHYVGGAPFVSIKHPCLLIFKSALTSNATKG